MAPGLVPDGAGGRQSLFHTIAQFDIRAHAILQSGVQRRAPVNALLRDSGSRVQEQNNQANGASHVVACALPAASSFLERVVPPDEARIKSRQNAVRKKATRANAGSHSRRIFEPNSLAPQSEAMIRRRGF